MSTATIIDSTTPLLVKAEAIATREDETSWTVKTVVVVEISGKKKRFKTEALVHKTETGYAADGFTERLLLRELKDDMVDRLKAGAEADLGQAIHDPRDASGAAEGALCFGEDHRIHLNAQILVAALRDAGIEGVGEVADELIEDLSAVGVKFE